MIEQDRVREKAPHWFTRSTTPLKAGGGDGTSDGMDPWQQTVESRLADLGDDVRDLRRWFGGGVILILTVFAGGFMLLLGRMDDGFDRSDRKAEAIDLRMSEVAQSQARIEAILTERARTPNPER